jgi:hypothetical protein
MSKKRSKIESEKVLSENSFKASKNEKGGNNGGVIIGILVLIIGVLYTYQNKKNPIANNHIVNDLNFTKYPVPLQLHHIQNKECENITNWISSDPIAPNIDSSNFWGAYRPGLYFGKYLCPIFSLCIISYLLTMYIFCVIITSIG